MELTVFGAGRLGLVAGACFASRGHRVVCIDIDADHIACLGRGHLPVHEPGLAELTADARRSGRLAFTTDAAAGVAHGDILFVAVGTPALPDGAADVAQVLQVASAIGRHLDAPKTVAVTSTVPVGTAEQVRARIAALLAKRGLDMGFDVVSNPEFLKEGAAIADFTSPDRIVIGSDSRDAARCLERLYAPFNRGRDRVVRMGTRSAEFAKYAANAMLASRVSLMNELADLAGRLGADIEAVRRGIGSDARIGAAVRADPVVFRRSAGGTHHRPLGPGLQARHRRYARGPEPRADRAALGRRRRGARLRPGHPSCIPSGLRLKAQTRPRIYDFSSVTPMLADNIFFKKIISNFHGRRSGSAGREFARPISRNSPSFIS